MSARINSAAPLGRRIMAESIAARLRERLAECMHCGAQLDDGDRRLCSECRAHPAHLRPESRMLPEGLR